MMDFKQRFMGKVSIVTKKGLRENLFEPDYAAYDLPKSSTVKQFRKNRQICFSNPQNSRTVILQNNSTMSKLQNSLSRFNHNKSISMTNKRHKKASSQTARSLLEQLTSPQLQNNLSTKDKDKNYNINNSTTLSRQIQSKQRRKYNTSNLRRLQPMLNNNIKQIIIQKNIQNDVSEISLKSNFGSKLIEEQKKNNLPSFFIDSMLEKHSVFLKMLDKKVSYKI